MSKMSMKTQLSGMLTMQCIAFISFSLIWAVQSKGVPKGLAHVFDFLKDLINFLKDSIGFRKNSIDFLQDSRLDLNVGARLDLNVLRGRAAARPHK